MLLTMVRVVGAVLLLLAGSVGAFAPSVAGRRRGGSLRASLTSEQVFNAASNQVNQFKKSHVGAPPAELQVLEQLLKDKAEQEKIGACMFELMCTGFLDYDRDVEDPERLVPSPSAGAPIPKEAEGLLELMTYLYQYGINMIPSGLISLEDCKRIVEERLAKRVGLTGEELDEWLDV